MATIQIRNLPEDVHLTYKVRAAAAGMSLQEYLRSELTRGARLQTPGELVSQIEARIAAEGPAGYATRSSHRRVRADRDAH
jgi:plasmid stability protein